MSLVAFTHILLLCASDTEGKVKPASVPDQRSTSSAKESEFALNMKLVIVGVIY